MVPPGQEYTHCVPDAVEPLGQSLRHWLLLLGFTDEPVGQGDERVSIFDTLTPSLVGLLQ